VSDRLFDCLLRQCVNRQSRRARCARLFGLESKFAPGRETEGGEQTVAWLFSQLRRFVLFGGVPENVKGEALGFPLGCCLALCDESVQAYSDLSWLGLIGFGNFYFKYSVPIGCFDVIVFHGLR
jgi:hypothetical protein